MDYCLVNCFVYDSKSVHCPLNNKQKGDIIFTISKASDVHLTKDDLQMDSYNISNVDDLTPPATPFGSSMSCSSTPISSNVPSLIQRKDVPQTPVLPNSESPKFTFQDSQTKVPPNISFMIVGHSSYVL